MSKLYKLVIYVPISAADKIRQVLGDSGAGHIGNYDFTSFSVRSTGRFRPLKGAEPAIGRIGKLESAEEERVETAVEEEILADTVFKVRKVHPYEEPIIEIYELK